MKKYIALCILLIAAAVYAMPPSPPSSSYTLPANIASNTTGTAAGLSGTPNIDVNNLTVAGTANVTGVTWTGLDAASVTGLATDNSTASHMVYKNAGGNIDDLALLNGLTLTGGNLSIANPVVTSLSVSGNVYMSVAANGSNAPSGTPIVITVYDVATNTPYYFHAYPTSGIE